jgi:hypothetical protein
MWLRGPCRWVYTMETPSNDMTSLIHPSVMNLWNQLLRFAALRCKATSRMDSLLQDASGLSDAQRDESHLAYWVADSVVEPDNDLEELVLARDRFKRRYLNSASRVRRWESLVERGRALNSEHTLDHFSAVTGHSIEDVLRQSGSGTPASVPEPSRILAPSVQRSLRVTYSSGVMNRFGGAVFFDAQARRIQRMGSRAVVSVLSVYLVLIMVGSWQPALDPAMVANRIPQYSWLELGSTQRGRYIPPEMFVTRHYALAVRKLRKVNTSILGYLPGFRTELLNEGIREMEYAIVFQGAGGYIYPEAMILLADAYLKAGFPEKAIPLINKVIARNERHATEARNLRSKLRRKGLYPQFDRP